MSPSGRPDPPTAEAIKQAGRPLALEKQRLIYTVHYSPWSAYSGGGQRSAHHLAKGMAERGHDVHLLCTRGLLESVAPPSDLPYSLHWAFRPQAGSRRNTFFRPLTAFDVRRRVRKLILESSLPTVVHSNGEEGWLLPTLLKSHNVLLVATPRYSSYPPRLSGWPKLSPITRGHLICSNWKHLCQAHLLSRCHLVCPPSDWASRELLRLLRLDPSRMFTVHNGVPEPFLSVERQPVTFRSPILFFGRLSRDKGVDMLIRAYRQLERPAPPLWIAGDGEQRPALEKTAQQLGFGNEVCFLGWQNRDQLLDLLSGASMAVLPSRHENFSLSILSAMGAGLPTVSTRTGGTPELIEDRRNGRLVDPDNTEALAQVMRELLRSPRAAQALGQRARQTVLDRFTWRKSCDRLEALYAEMTSRPESRTT